jgi:hypothetical protein
MNMLRIKLMISLFFLADGLNLLNNSQNDSNHFMTAKKFHSNYFDYFHYYSAGMKVFRLNSKKLQFNLLALCYIFEISI